MLEAGGSGRDRVHFVVARYEKAGEILPAEDADQWPFRLPTHWHIREVDDAGEPTGCREHLDTELSGRVEPPSMSATMPFPPKRRREPPAPP